MTPERFRSGPRRGLYLQRPSAVPLSTTSTSVGSVGNQAFASPVMGTRMRPFAISAAVISLSHALHPSLMLIRRHWFNPDM